MTHIPDHDLRNSLSEQEIDRHIKSLGRLSEKAMADGDPAGARIWHDRMMAAIKGRSPEHKARLEVEALERLDADPCYFCAAGDRDRAALFDVPAAAVRRRSA